MIQIKISNTEVKEFYKKINTTKSNYKSLSCKLQELINELEGNNLLQEANIVKYVRKNLKHIIVNTPRGLEKIISDFEKKGYQDLIYNKGTDKLEELGKKIRKTFNYKSFRGTLNAKWLSETLAVKSCSYCNTQYTISTPKKSLYQFDHFYPKSIYPYLSLSFYNLIPSCVNCNQGKSKKLFKLNESVHPYIEGFNEIAEFKVEKENLVSFLINPIKNQNLVKHHIDLKAKYFGDNEYEEKYENYLKEFSIKEQYNNFDDVVSEMYLKSRYYDKARRKELRNFFEEEEIKLTEEMIRRFIVGNYVDDKDLLKRPLAKFMKDIGKNIHLIN
ncbi:HNH endonuclease domain-containing protein [Tenacibaculum sp.]|uniref:HNH endonuclease domain-containing protein n=1 Tax=Tenacibaculum sp. TaxID=1906242 RepID=UPI003D0E7C4F